MTHLDAPSEPADIPEDIVHWQPQHGPLIGSGHMDGAVVIAATVGALAMLGLTAGAFLAGRASRRDL